ncbi:cyclic pyranopterin monophosphate synthase, mitochondrial-like isoform X2 [Dioscorea cayenensis subsp. rotundata]|nr:cyclic pyranopterin monophosphate synthase, mitochondrial-like isoform X2 [Dioscorea cayenensis subsp. rotundata]
MELIFGETPPSSVMDSTSQTQESQVTTSRLDESQQSLSHVDVCGQVSMVDISSKADSKRVAVAGCRVLLGKKAFDLVAANQIAKGDVLAVAKIAGISGAKQTSNLIPLCHNIGLTYVQLDLTLNGKDCSVDIEGEVAITGKTGVEMEAMTAVTVAGLTIYDMCKAVSKDISITNIHLKHKSGGKSGHWSKNS